MAVLYFKIASDWEEVQKLRQEIDKLRSSLSGFDIGKSPEQVKELEKTLQSCTDKYQALISEAAKSGAMIENDIKKKIESINAPTDNLKAFDSQILQMSQNLGKYFDDLLIKLNTVKDLLGGGKTIADNVAVNRNNVEQIEEVKQKNEELTAQIEKQKDEILKQKEAWDNLANAVRTNNVSAIQQYSTVAASSADKGQLREQAKQLTSDIRTQETEVLNLKTQWEQAYNRLIDYEGILKDSKSIGGSNDTAYSNAALHIDEARTKEKSLDDGYSQATQKLQDQKQQLVEINGQLDNSSQKHLRIRTLIMDGREELIKMQQAGMTNTAEFQQTAEHVGDLRKQMVLANATMQYFADPARHITALKTGIQGLVGATSLLTGVTGLFISDNKEMEEIQTRVQSLLSVSIGLEQTYSAVKKSSMFMQEIYNIQRKAGIAAQELDNAAKEKGIALTWGETAAQRAYNLVANANPYVLLATAAITLIGAIALVTFATKHQTEAEKEHLRMINEVYAEQNRYAASVAEKASGQISSYEKLRAEWLALGKDQKAQNKFIIDNKDAFHSLGVAVNSVSEANNYLVSQSGNVVKALMAQAKAAAAFEIAKDYQKTIINRTLTAKYKLPDKYKMTTTVDTNTGDVIPMKTLKSASEYKHDMEKAQKERAAVIKQQNKDDEDYSNRAINLSSFFQKSAQGTYNKSGVKTYNSNEDKQDRANVAAAKRAAAAKRRAEKEREQQIADLNKQGDLQNRIKEIDTKYEKQKTDTGRDIEDKVTQARINAMEDGSKKILAQLNYNNNKELEENEKAKQDYIKKITDIEKQKFEEEENLKTKKNKKYVKKQWQGSYAQKNLKVDTSSFDNFADITSSNQVKDWTDKQKQAMNEYLENYGTFQQQKLAIALEYAEKIKRASSQGEKLSIGKEKNERIASVTTNELKSKIDWATVFGGFSGILNSEVEKVIENLRLYTRTDQFKQSSPTDQKTIYDGIQKLENIAEGSLKNLGLNKLGKEVKDYETAIQSLNTAKANELLASENLTKAQNDLANAQKNGSAQEISSAKRGVQIAQTAMDSASNSVVVASQTTEETGNTVKTHAEKVTNTLEGVANDLQKMASGSLAEAFQGISGLFTKLASNSAVTGALANTLGKGGLIAQIISAILSILDVLKQGIGHLVGNLIETVLTAVGGIIKEILSGKIFSNIGDGLYEGIKSILHPIASAVGLGGLFKGADYSSYNDLKKHYESLISLWNDLISKKQEYLNESYGSEVLKTEQEMEALYKKEITSYQTLGKARLSSGASTGSHSIGVRQWKSMSGEAKKEIESYLGSNYEAILGSRMEGLFDMNASQLEKLRDNNQVFWAGLDSDVQTYLNNIISAGDALTDSLKKSETQLLGTSFDSLLDEFSSTLNDMSSDSETFSKNFEKYMEKAIINSLVVSKYKSQLQTWYDKWYSDLKNGNNISQSEYDAMKEGYESIMKNAKGEVSALQEMFGWTSTDSTSGSTVSTTAASQETVDAANGRMTAINETNQEIKSLLDINLATIRISLVSSVSIADETRTYIIKSYDELTRIHDDTTSLVKTVNNVSEKIDGWDSKIRNL